MKSIKFRVRVYEFLRDWYISIFYRCKKCNGKLDLKHEGAQHWKNIPPLIGGWYHINCSRMGGEPPKKGILPF